MQALEMNSLQTHARTHHVATAVIDPSLGVGERAKRFRTRADLTTELHGRPASGAHMCGAYSTPSRTIVDANLLGRPCRWGGGETRASTARPLTPAAPTSAATDRARADGTAIATSRAARQERRALPWLNHTQHERASADLCARDKYFWTVWRAERAGNRIRNQRGQQMHEDITMRCSKCVPRPGKLQSRRPFEFYLACMLNNTPCTSCRQPRPITSCRSASATARPLLRLQWHACPGPVVYHLACQQILSLLLP
jgi:hypothetical protein